MWCDQTARVHVFTPLSTRFIPVKTGEKKRDARADRRAKREEEGFLQCIQVAAAIVLGMVKGVPSLSLPLILRRRGWIGKKEEKGNH